MRGFLRRHREISLRVPEMTSLGRIMRFNKPQVKIFFDLLKIELNKHHFMPSRIFNADETGVLYLLSQPRFQTFWLQEESNV